MRKSKLITNRIFTVTVTVFLIISVFILVAYLFLCVMIHSKDIEKIDGEYAMFKAEEQVESKIYTFENSESLKFFADYCNLIKAPKITKFLTTVPILKIINDGESYVEITTNKDVHDIINVYDFDDDIVIDFKNEFYNTIHQDNIDYDYDYGLYVDCSVFEVIVHASILKFETNIKHEIDFDVAPGDKVDCDFGHHGVYGRIYNIESKEFDMNCGGITRLELYGTVENNARLMIFHDSRIDARKLSAGEFDNFVSRGMGGISYIRFDKWYKFHCNIIGGPTNIIAFIIWSSPVLWTFSLIRLKKRQSVCNE